MTSPRPPQSNDDAKAAAFFTGALTLAAGGAGFLVAGLVLGFDYLLHGQPDERAQLAERRARDSRQRYDDALAWLEADRTDRARARRAKREWFNADPETRGDAPATGETFGRLAARMWNSLIVGGGRFRRGWKAGRDEAKRRREDGDPNWWKPRKNPRWPADHVPDTDTQIPDPSAKQDEPDPTTAPPVPPIDEVIDAEIVPDPDQPADRDVVPVGDEHARPQTDADLDEYARRLNDLDEEVSANRNHQPADPSPSFPR